MYVMLHTISHRANPFARRGLARVKMKRGGSTVLKTEPKTWKKLAPASIRRNNRKFGRQRHPASILRVVSAGRKMKPADIQEWTMNNPREF